MKEQESVFKSAAGHWVVARRDSMDPSSKGGVIIPAAAMAQLQKEVATGLVLCVGPGGVLGNGMRIDRPCSGGDRICWSRYGERVLHESDEGDLVAIPFQEVIGVIEEPKAKPETPVIRGLSIVRN